MFHFSIVNHAVQEPKAIAQAPEGEGCPRCGGFVYAAEQMLARARVSVFTVAVYNYLMEFLTLTYENNKEFKNC